jgi:carboxypeptidase T
MLRGAKSLIVVVLSCITALLILHAVAALAGERLDSSTTGQLIVRVYFADRAALARLAAELDIWEVNRAEQFVVARIDQSAYRALLARGYRVEIDQAKTAQLNQPRAVLPDQTSGIPSFPCYRTVEETLATAQALVAAHPDLAEVIDIGDTWEKTASGGSAGYDLVVLKLTNRNVPGPKPQFFAMSSMHARELAPAELNTRFAEYLIDHYGVDADATWLLDYTEIHLLLQANPDGRKRAEQLLYWRKNADNDYCANTDYRGVDLNRNYPFGWGGAGSSTSECSDIYRGPGAASEPEAQAVVNYLRTLFPDQRPADRTTPAPADATGLFLDLHSYGSQVLWPWGDTFSTAPNAVALTTLGRKFAFFNGYTPEQAVGLYPTSGTTDDFAYGELGVAAYTFEVGTDFFESCSYFENTLLPDNLPALIYAAKAARQPYQTPAGPDVIDVNVTPTTTIGGRTIVVQAAADDRRYASGEAQQAIVAAYYSLDAPAWLTGTITHSLAVADGAWDSPVESITTTIDTSDWSAGRHTLFLEARDAAGNRGVPSAGFVWVENGSVPALSPAEAVGAGDLGSTVAYTLSMSNQGHLTGTFDLAVAGNVWPTSLSTPASTVTLAPDEAAALTVWVTLPITWPAVLSDTATITLSGPDGAAASRLITRALPYRFFLPVIR